VNQFDNYANCAKTRHFKTTSTKEFSCLAIATSAHGANPGIVEDL